MPVHNVQQESLWRPLDTLQQNMANLYHSQDEKDACFKLDDGHLVWAHRCLLSVNSPTLHDMVATSDGQAEICNADPELFAVMIRSMYFNNLPSAFDVKKDGLALLKLANRFDCRQLKLRMEAELIDAGIITIKNAAEILFLADSHCCAMLKEASMQFVAANYYKVSKTKAGKELKKTPALLHEVLDNTSKKLFMPGGETFADMQKKPVSELRQIVAEMGLDADGTKEMLLQQLWASQDVEMSDSDDMSDSESDDE